MKKIYWACWAILTLAIGGYFFYTMFAAEDKSDLLIGEATHGHFQIELSCGSCHTEAFGGGEVLQNACVDCHGEELKQARDSHPRKKFTDPRNADLVDILDARYCVSCHTEHQQEQTHEMGVTVPDDYCFHCHVDVGKERASHKDLPFDSCATAGCHNFHDNTALYEDFLVENSGQPWLSAVASLALPNAAKEKAPTTVTGRSQAFTQHISDHPDIEQQVLVSSHGQAGVSCAGCHTGEDKQWIEKPEPAACQSCHSKETESFLASKHGMRLAAGLDAMRPGISNMPFKANAAELEQGCNACHSAHEFNPQQAAVDSCVACHDDNHTRNFFASPHGELTQQAQSGALPWEQAVTCATCHLPRETHKKSDIVSVQHNQNFNLRPNEKMIRTVCMSCHSLEFSIDALADEVVINNNFKGKPHDHIPSVDWAVDRVKH